MVQAAEVRVVATGGEGGLHDLEVQPGFGRHAATADTVAEHRRELARVRVEPPTLGAGPFGHARGPTRIDVEHEEIHVLMTSQQDGGGAPHGAGPEDRDAAQPVTLKAGRATGP